MQKRTVEMLGRALIALLIMASGTALVANANREEKPLNWRMFAGGYEPDLEVNHDKGAPGSIFAFVGVGYPPNSLATVYADGLIVGHVTTSNLGVLTFMIDSEGGSEGRYFITAAAGANASDTKDFDLEWDEPMWPAPPGFPGPTFPLLGGATATPPATPSATPPVTPSVTPSATPSATLSATPTQTPEPTVTGEPTETPTPTETAPPTATAVVTETPAPTATATATAAPTETPAAAALTTNFTTGRPGSFFTFSGNSFASNQTVDVTLRFNGTERQIGAVQSDAAGNFSFILDTWQALPGFYTVQVSDGGQQDAVELELQGVFLLREKEGNAQMLYIMQSVYVPFAPRQ